MGIQSKLPYNISTMGHIVKATTLYKYHGEYSQAFQIYLDYWNFASGQITQLLNYLVFTFSTLFLSLSFIRFFNPFYLNCFLYGYLSVCQFACFLVLLPFYLSVSFLFISNKLLRFNVQYVFVNKQKIKMCFFIIFRRIQRDSF